MKIGLMHYSSPPVVGGVESVLAQHARLMAKAGHTVTILTGRGEAFDPQIPVKLLPRFNSRHPEILEVKKLLDAGEVTPQFERLCQALTADLLAGVRELDLLIAHNLASLHKNLALTAALNASYRTPGFPRLILWHHDLAWTSPRYRRELHPGEPWELLRRPWAGAADVTVSELRRGELAGLYGLPASFIRVVPNGVDLNTFFKLEPETVRLARQLDLAAADPLLLLPVRLTPRKNIELALQVLVELRRLLPGAVLLVTGPEGAHNPANAAYRENLLRQRDALGLRGAAHFLAESVDGFLPDAVVADFYRLADALLFPSREEGFGIPLLEAAFDALPVFCADLPVLRELGGADASYFDPDAAPSAIARQIAGRLESEATSRLARRVKHRFSWETIYAERIEPLIQEVMK